MWIVRKGVLFFQEIVLFVREPSTNEKKENMSDHYFLWSMQEHMHFVMNTCENAI